MVYNKSQSHFDNLAYARDILNNNKINCIFCKNKFSKANIEKHQTSCHKNADACIVCKVCGFLFKPKIKNKKLTVTCSHGCANTYFRSGENHPNWAKTNYRLICFTQHDKKCCICDEKLIVEVHHLDGNRANNFVENLIPMCPTHHQYWHSRYKYMIEKKVINYIENFRVRALLP